MMPTTEKINEAYARLAKQEERTVHFGAQLAQRKRERDRKFTAMLTIAEGKTAKDREAWAKTQCENEEERIEETQAAYDGFRLQRRLAEIDIERIRLLVRVVEINVNSHQE